MLVTSMPRLPPMIAMPWTSSCRCCNKRQRCGYGYRVWQSLVAPARAALDAPLRRAMSGEANAQNELLLQHSTAKPICERCDKDHDLPATNERVPNPAATRNTTRTYPPQTGKQNCKLQANGLGKHGGGCQTSETTWVPAPASRNGDLEVLLKNLGVL